MSEQFKSIETTELIKIANAIRVKTGNNEQIALKDMPDKIRSIEGGGIYLPELEFEGSSADLLAGKQLIDSEGNIVTGTIPTTAQATPTISVNSTGKITATASQSAGYVEAGTKTATHQLDVQAAQTITPSTSDKTIAAGKYLTGTQTIKGDANLKAANIAEGVSIFGVVGTHAGDSGGVELPTLTNEGVASDLLSGKQLIDGDGNIVEGTIATKTASDLTVSGATVTVPSGYYATQAAKSVATVTRANTTISTTADDTNDKLTITASNNQTTGYVTGENKTASTTISLSASGATVTASDGTNKISKSVATATQATPSVSINSSGLITATATQTAGYVSAGTKSATHQLAFQAAKTITPTTASQIAVSSGYYTGGDVTVAGDSNLVAGNIKSGVSIFGVAGTHSGGSGGFPNGTEWTQSNIAKANGYFNAVHCEDGLWVAGGGMNVGLYYSEDGKTWMQSNITTSTFFKAVHKANGLWVASAISGLYYSEDGKIWMQSNITSDGTKAIVYANGLWVTGEKAYYSEDGKTWIQGTLSDVRDILFANGLWVASASNNLYYSEDGKTWTKSITIGSRISSLYYANGTWIALGSSGIYRSSNGKKWGKVYNLSNGFYAYYAKGVWLAVCNSGLYYSINDGITWNISNIQGNTPSSDYSRTIHYANGVFVMGNYDGSYYSYDGINWHAANITDSGRWNFYNADGIWVAASPSGLYYSVTWEPTT